MFDKRFKAFFLGLLGGILFYLSFSKYNLSFLIFPALFLSFRKEKITFFTFGITSFVLSLLWLRLSIIQSGEYSSVVALFIAIFISLLLSSIQFGLTYILWKLLKFNLLLLPFIYTFVELLRSYYPFSGFPWLLLGTSLVDIPVLKYSLVPLGVYGGSLVVIFLSLLPHFKKQRVFILFVISLYTLIGFFQKESREPQKPIKIAIIQTNIPQAVKLNTELFEKEYPAIIRLIKQAQEKKPDLIILPESTLPFYLNELETKGEELLKLSKRTPIILGVIEIEEPFIPYNAVVMLYKGMVVNKYRKSILVPFGEYTPFPFKYLSNLIPYFGLTDYRKGEGAKCFEVKGVSVGTPICFEVAYPFYIKSFNCSFMAVLTNDGWFLNSDGTYQHMKLARVRALENGKFFLWVNNTGPSGVISPEGKVLRLIPYGERGILFFSF